MSHAQLSRIEHRDQYAIDGQRSDMEKQGLSDREARTACELENLFMEVIQAKRAMNERGIEPGDFGTMFNAFLVEFDMKATLLRVQ